MVRTLWRRALITDLISIFTEIYFNHIMKNNKLFSNTLALSIFLSFSSIAVLSQEPFSNNQFANAVETYNTSNYVIAEKLFSDMLGNPACKQPLRYDAQYYRLMCLVKQNNRFAENEISDYLSKHAESPWENQLWSELGKFSLPTAGIKLLRKPSKMSTRLSLPKSMLTTLGFIMGIDLTLEIIKSITIFFRH